MLTDILTEQLHNSMPKVDENINGAPKFEINFGALPKCKFFPYFDSNIELSYIALCWFITHPTSLLHFCIGFVAPILFMALCDSTK